MTAREREEGKLLCGDKMIFVFGVFFPPPFFPSFLFGDWKGRKKEGHERRREMREMDDDDECKRRDVGKQIEEREGGRGREGGVGAQARGIKSSRHIRTHILLCVLLFSISAAAAVSAAATAVNRTHSLTPLFLLIS